MLSALPFFLLVQNSATDVKPRETRYQLTAPLTTLPALMLDVDGNGVGIAQQTARSKSVQARILWIDGTANLTRVSSESSIQSLIRKAKEVGFNTVVFDVKPIVGYTLYPSKITSKITKWKAQKLDLNFDPLAAMSKVCNAEKMPLFVSMNTFAEGHRNAKNDANAAELFGKPGEGYSHKEWQTVLYEPTLQVTNVWHEASFPGSNLPNVLPANGESLGFFVKGSAPKSAPAGSYGVIVDDTGTVIQSVEPGSWTFPGIPEGGSIVLGVGKAAQFLRDNFKVNRRMVLESKPDFVTIDQRPEQQIPLMLNPASSAVQQRVLSFVDEISKNYSIQGMIFDDRLRWAGMNADFSEETRSKFESYVGQKLEWPKDVFEYSYNFDLTKGLKPGKWFDTWMAWRCQVLTQWVSSARDTLQRNRPEAQLGVYAGSWYGEYPKYGNNWASTSLRAGFSFLNDNYRKTGYAGVVDFLITGCYYRVPTIYEALNHNLPAGRTVESAGQLMNRCVRDESWAYAGIQLMDFKNRKAALKNAIQAACGSTQGVMVFDVSHDIEEFWDVFAMAFHEKRDAPHSVSGLLNSVRNQRKQLDLLGKPEPPVIIREGAAGTGM